MSKIVTSKSELKKVVTNLPKNKEEQDVIGGGTYLHL